MWLLCLVYFVILLDLYTVFENYFRKGVGVTLRAYVCELIGLRPIKSFLINSSLTTFELDMCILLVLFVFFPDAYIEVMRISHSVQDMVKGWLDFSFFHP